MTAIDRGRDRNLDAVDRLNAGGPLLLADIRTAIQSLVDIAALAMPDSYFASDSRVALARAILGRTAGATQVPIDLDHAGLDLSPVRLGSHWAIDFLGPPNSQQESWIVVKADLSMAGEAWRTISGVIVPDPDDETLAATTNRVAELQVELQVELSGPVTTATVPAVTATRAAHLHFGRQAWRLDDWRREYFGRTYIALTRNPLYDLPPAGGPEPTADV